MARMIHLRFPQLGRILSMVRDLGKATYCMVVVCVKIYFVGLGFSRFENNFRQDKHSTHCICMYLTLCIHMKPFQRDQR